jgi:hypothetical protein
MDNNNANRQQQGGTGSAEQTGRGRQEQKTPTTDRTGQEKADVASQIGENKNDVRTIEDLGGKSGRDDAAGGSGNQMENESSNESTEKFGRGL